MLGDANVICSNFYFATLVNEMSAQPAFIYSFEYLSGWNSNRNTGAFFQETNANLKFEENVILVNCQIYNNFENNLMYNRVCSVKSQRYLETSFKSVVF